MWGNLQTGALGVPYLKKNRNTLQRECLGAPKRLGFAEKFPVCCTIIQISKHLQFGCRLRLRPAVSGLPPLLWTPTPGTNYMEPDSTPTRKLAATKSEADTL